VSAADVFQSDADVVHSAAILGGLKPCVVGLDARLCQSAACVLLSAASLFQSDAVVGELRSRVGGPTDIGGGSDDVGFQSANALFQSNEAGLVSAGLAALPTHSTARRTTLALIVLRPIWTCELYRPQHT